MRESITQEFAQRCINDIMAGLRDGLTRFSGCSSIAVIYRLPHQKRLSIFDPDCLLRGHELKLSNFYFENKFFSYHSAHPRSSYALIDPVIDPALDGLLSRGGSSAPVPYQLWFTEHHPDMISSGPTLCWLKYAVLRFSHDIANRETLYTGISGNFLKEYAKYAIFNYLQNDLESHNLASTRELPLFAILESILGISKTREEGAWPFGKIGFIPPDIKESTTFLARFSDNQLPRLDHAKHVRKLMQTVEETHHTLISDGSTILGICDISHGQCLLTADFHGRYGYLRFKGQTICSFADGEYKSSSLRAKLYEVEEALLEYNLEPGARSNLFSIISYLVHTAQERRYGCAFVLDLNERPLRISGQQLQTPLNLNASHILKLACSLSKVDGALHIHKNQHLIGFACLLDGTSIEGEDRARGARYNSALRFTSENKDTIVVVVSSDRPVSVIYRGIAFHGHCQWQPKTGCSQPPEPLEQWLKAGT